MGIATVAVYSNADAQAQHVQQADEAVYIGESPAAQSYLQIERIIQAALTQAQKPFIQVMAFYLKMTNLPMPAKKTTLSLLVHLSNAILAMGLKATSKCLNGKSRCTADTGLPWHQPRS